MPQVKLKSPALMSTLDWNNSTSNAGKFFILYEADEDFRITGFVKGFNQNKRETKYPLDTEAGLEEGNYILSGGSRSTRVDKKFRVDIFGLVEVEG